MNSSAETAIFYIADRCDRITAINLRSITRWITRHSNIPVKVIVYYNQSQSIIKLSDRFEKFAWRRLRDLSTAKILLRIIFSRKAERALVFSDGEILHTADFIPLLNFIRQKTNPLVLPRLKQFRITKRDTNSLRTLLAYFASRTHAFFTEHIRSIIPSSGFPSAIHLRNMRFTILQLPRKKRFFWYKELSHRFTTDNLRLFMASAGINNIPAIMRSKRITYYTNGFFNTLTGLYKTIQFILREKNKDIKIPLTEWLLPVAQLSLYLFIFSKLAGVKKAEMLLYCAALFSFPWFLKPYGFRSFRYFIPDLFFRLLYFPVL
jgi:hypothetical protein